MFAAISSILHIPYNWLTKLMYVGIIIAIWNIALGANQSALIQLNNYILNISLYQFLPESSIVKIEQVFVLFATWHLLVWLFSHDRHGPPGGH